MEIRSRLAVAFGPERKRRVRSVDAVLVPGVGVGIGLPPIAWILYRETTIGRLERLAIMLLIMATGHALLHVGMEQAARAA